MLAGIYAAASSPTPRRLRRIPTNGCRCGNDFGHFVLVVRYSSRSTVRDTAHMLHVGFHLEYVAFVHPSLQVRKCTHTDRPVIVIVWLQGCFSFPRVLPFCRCSDCANGMLPMIRVRHGNASANANRCTAVLQFITLALFVAHGVLIPPPPILPAWVSLPRVRTALRRHLMRPVKEERAGARAIAHRASAKAWTRSTRRWKLPATRPFNEDRLRFVQAGPGA